MRSIVVAVSLSLLPLAAGGADPWGDLIAEMRGAHPGLAAQAAGVAALAELPDAADALPDPMVAFGVMNLPVDSLAFDKEPMTQKSLALTQSIPPGAQREGLRHKADAAHRMGVADERTTVAALTAALVTTVAAVAHADRRLAILASNARLMDDLIVITAAKYETGKGAQANVIQAQVERSKLIEATIAVRALRERSVARLNRLLGRPQRTPFDAAPYAFAPPTLVDDEAVRAAARRAYPGVAKAEAALAQARAALAVEEGALYPTTNLTLAYGQRDDTPMTRADFVSATAAFSLPIWRSGKQDKRIAAARFRLAEATDRLADAVADAEERAVDALIRYRGSDETVRLYESAIIPQSIQARRAARAGYRSDQADFFTLISSELAALRHETELTRAVFERRAAVAELARTTGAYTDNGETDARQD